MKKKLLINTKDRRLLNNTFYLYIMTFSSMLFGFITIPYLTRVLGPSVFGKTGLAQAYMVYVQVFLDFGFILSATQKVASADNNKIMLSQIVSSVFIAKIIIAIFIITIFTIYILNSSLMSVDWLFYLLFLLSTVIGAMMPDFFYRGIQNMKTITLRTFFIKGFSTGLTFIFIRSASDSWMIPLFPLLGNLLSAGLMYWDMKRTYGVTFCKVSLHTTRVMITDSLPFFVSRAASTVYQSLNMIIMSLLYGSSPMVGYYTTADKFINLGKTVSSPIADSLYPYMIKEKNYKLVKRLLIFAMPAILIGTLFIYKYAEPISVFLFGQDYAATGEVLRRLLPILVVILPTFILSFPVMVPLGLVKWANFSDLVGLIIQISGLIILNFSDKLNVYSLCSLTSLSEVSVFLFRLLVVLYHVKKQGMKKLENISI